MPQDNPNYTYR